MNTPNNNMDYARQLIQKCKQAHATNPDSDEAKILDLGYCGLTKLPDEVFDCDWIETLVVSNNYEYWDEEKGNWQWIGERNRKKLNRIRYTELPKRINVFRALKSLYWGGGSRRIKRYALEKITNLDNLPKLEHLNLGCNRIKEIKGLEELGLLKSLYLGSNQISEIKGLEKLSQLQALNLYGTSSINEYPHNNEHRNPISEIKGLETLSQLRTLNLSSNQISEIKGLKNLTKLQKLSLHSNRISEIKGLKTLNQLQTLNLGSNQISEIKGLGRLYNLQSLDLGGFWGRNKISRIKGLEELSNLKSLDLCYNQLSTLEGLPVLKNLQSLDLHSNQLSTLEGLPVLKNLQSLDLHSNQLTTLKALPLLENLQSLNLHSNQLTTLKALPLLENLQSLDLHSNQLTTLKALPLLENLQSLDFHFNQLTTLKGLPLLEKLQSLDLHSNQLTTLKCLPLLKNLQSLNLYSNQLTTLKGLPVLTKLQGLAINDNQLQCFPFYLLEYGLKELCLFNNPIQNIPQELLGEESYDDCLLDIQNYKNALQKGSTPDNTVKLIFVGNGRVGKTCVAAVLQGKDFPINSESTHGITIAQWQPQNTSVKFSLWDFGGQEIYHATHRLFLSQNALYVLVWATTTEEAETEARHPLSYWLDYIQDLSPQSSIILVENQIDKNNYQRSPITNEAAIKAHYTIGDNLAISAKTGKNLRSLKAALLDQAEAIVEKRQYKIPLTWQKLQYRLIQNRDNGTKRLTHQEYLAIAQKEDIEPEEANTILLYLHRSSFLYYQSNAFNNTIILDQNWAIDAVYKVFNRNLPHEKHIKTQGGYFPKIYAYDTIWQNTPNEEVEIYLDFMKSCEIAYSEKRWRSDENEDTEYLIPQFLPPHPSKQCKRNWKNIGSAGLYVRLEHHFFHLAVLQRFIIRAAHLAENYGLWQKGIWITDEQNDVEALIGVVEMGQSSSNYPLYQIQIRTGGQTAKDYTFLQQIRNEFYKIRSTNLTVWLSVNGEQFTQENTLQQQNKLGNTHIQCQCNTVVPIATFEAFLKYQSNKEGLENIQQPPQAQTTPKKVVVLYHPNPKDETHLHELSNELKMLERKRKVAVWDVRNIKVGEWKEDAIMEQLKAADLVVALISRDFLASDAHHAFTQFAQTETDCILLALLIRPSSYKYASFAHLQVLPKNGTPISKWKDEDEAWLAIAEGLREVV